MMKYISTIFAIFAAVVSAQDKFENDVGMTCYPQVVAAGQPVNVNVWYTLTHARPVDIHVNLLNHDSKLYYAGNIVEVDGQRGEATVSFTLPDFVQEPFMWKVYLTPRGEPFPNFIDGKGADKQGVSETGMVIPLGAEVVGQCPDIGVNSFTPNVRGMGNSYVQIVNKPDTFNDGAPLSIDVESYSTIGPADVTMTLMKQGENTVIASTTVPVEAGKSMQTITLDTPAGKGAYDVKYRNDVTNVEYPVYVVVYMTPKAGSWEQSVASDRVYTIVLN